MQICEKCVTLRDVLIDKLAAYGTFLLAVNDHTRAGNLDSARDAEASATRAGNEIVKAKAELDDHTESHN